MDSALATLNPDASLEVYHEEAEMRKLVFEISEANPHKIPMTRLLEYLTELATVLGSRSEVHFLRVEDGSLPCYMEVEDAAEPVVISRARDVAKGEGTQEAQQAYRNLCAFLKDDEYSAELRSEIGDLIVDFPLAPDERPIFGPFLEDGTLDGILINIGGTDDTVPVHLLSEGTRLKCNASVEMARRLGHYLLQKPIRVRGKGRWYRNAHGKWELHWFDILDFEELDDSSLPEVVSRLRAIRGNDLMSLTDPLEEMRKIRHGE